jgi:DNA-binding transcriptional MerR regulator
VDATTVGEAALRTGWSARMLRYLERTGLVVPGRSASGYRLYGLRELNQLRSLAELRRRFHVEISDLAFAARLRREPDLKAAVDTWFAVNTDALEWEQRKHERLLAA